MTRGARAFRLILALTTVVTVGGVAHGDIIRLRPGFQKIIDRPEVTRISVGNPLVAQAHPLTRRGGILVVGKKEGSTDLVVWEGARRTDMTVEVSEPKPSLLESVRALSSHFPALTFTEAGGRIVVSGEVPSSRDKAFLEEFAKSRPDVLLRLSVPEDRRSLLSYDLKIMEINRGAVSQIGVRWPDSLGVQGTWSATNAAGGILSVGGDFDVRIRLLLADGRARILANPRIACESGETATFLAGGEIPIVIVTPESRTVEWKTYGIILKIHPRMDRDGRIRTQITAEISTIDHGSGSSDVPGFLTRRVTTLIGTPPGETIMLSGLVRSESAKDVSKVPLLGQIPVIGELFKSRSFRENETELAVFITPREIEGHQAADLAAWTDRHEREKEGTRFRLVD